MAVSKPNSLKDELELINAVLSPEMVDSPYRFAMFIYPWGQEGTPLAKMKGPRKWQREVMLEIEDYLRDAKQQQRQTNELPEFFKMAISSGRGPGKSALFGMIVHWFLSTRLGGTCIVTANTEPQLRSKTMPEISKWVNMGINSHWFDAQSLSIRPANWFKEVLESPQLKKDTKYFYAMANTWSEENPDAFAGAHNWSGEMYIYDEASGIPDPIWAVTEGVFTEPIPDRFWIVASNPRRNTGAFFECFHKHRNFWRQKHIDARQVEGIDQNTFKNIIAKHGADSDEARIEVYGEFPSSGGRQFIGMDAIRAAIGREPHIDEGAPLLMGVDVARFGEDRSVIAFRKGRDAKTIPWQTFRKLDTYQLAQRVAEAAEKYKPDAIFVDGGGVGGGVIDALKAMNIKAFEVQAGSRADDTDKYLNKRVEIWALLREWLEIGSIPDDKDLTDDLKSPDYEWHPTTNQLKLESKDHMKARGLASPDMAEALAQTFAKTVARRDVAHFRSAKAKLSGDRMPTGLQSWMM
jgi:hypothetical protein